MTGDGAFNINAMKIDSAKRHNAKVVFIVAVIKAVRCWPVLLRRIKAFPAMTADCW